MTGASGSPMATAPTPMSAPETIPTRRRSAAPAAPRPAWSRRPVRTAAGSTAKRMPRTTPVRRNGRPQRPPTNRNGPAAARSPSPKKPIPSANGSSPKRQHPEKTGKRPAPVKSAITSRRRRSLPPALRRRPATTATSACGPASSAYPSPVSWRWWYGINGRTGSKSGHIAIITTGQRL